MLAIGISTNPLCLRQISHNLEGLDVATVCANYYLLFGRFLEETKWDDLNVDGLCKKLRDDFDV